MHEKPTGEEKWPRTVKRGGAAVRIYRVQNRGRVAYQTVFWLGGSRQRRTFAAFRDAHSYADEQATLLNAGKLNIATLNDADREALIATRRLLEPLGIPLIEAVKLAVAAMKELDGRGSLIDAAREYRQRHETKLPDKPVADVVAELLAARKADGASHEHFRTLRSHLAASEDGEKPRNSFANAFRTNIADVTAPQIDAWLRKRDASPRTRKNILGSIQNLFSFAKSRGYLRKDQPTEADAVQTPKVKGGQIHIFTADVMARLLSAPLPEGFTEESRLFIALGAFSGLRTAELKRLEWREVSVARGFIEVAADKAKTASRRLVPIQPNLAQWLAPYAGHAGRVFTLSRPEESAHLLAEKLGIEWKPNVLRHSYISHRLAVANDVPRVALESGNSPAMIFANYRELVTPDEGAAWFAIAPDAPANVVPMEKGGAA